MKRFWSKVAMVALLALAAPVALALDRPEPALKSSSVLVIDQETGEVLMGRNSGAVVPIASLTKLMTALITVQSSLPLDEVITITSEDLDSYKGTGSRLRLGSQFTRDDLLKLALMASENRAASALGHSFPGGKAAFVEAMNAKARELNMDSTHFVEPTGLSSQNVSSAEDLAKLVRAAYTYPLIREYSTLTSHAVTIGKRQANFVNTNGLVRGGNWEIGLSKTGYISEAGRCLVMQAKLATRNVIIVLLDSWGKYTRIADASRIRAWLDPDFTAPVERASRKIRGKKAIKKKVKAVKARTKKAVKTKRSKAPVRARAKASGR